MHTQRSTTESGQTEQGLHKLEKGVGGLERRSTSAECTGEKDEVRERLQGRQGVKGVGGE